MLLFHSRFQGFPLIPGPVSRAFFSGSVLSAFCLFPFALPCFAPTAVPQVITFFRLSTSLRCGSLLLLSFVRFRLGSYYSASVFSFPSSRFSHHSWYLRCTYPSSIPPVSMLRFRLWYSAFLQFLSPLAVFASQVLLQLPTSCFQLGRPLSFRLRFRLLGRAMYPEN